MSEVNLWFARNKDNEIIKIWDITKEIKREEYTCPICGGILRPNQGNIKQWYFSHLNADDCDSEAKVHFWVKNELVKIGDKLKVRVNNEIKEFICKDILIEKEYLTKEGTYKPDLTIITENDEIIFLEIANTNRKRIKDYMSMWDILKNIVIEVEVKDILDGKSIEIYNAIYWYGKTYTDRVTDIRNYMTKEQLIEKYGNVNIEKINWLIDDIVKYETGQLDIDILSDEVQAIKGTEDRKLVVELLRKKCSNVISDYVDYNNKNINKEIKNLLYTYIPAKYLLKTPNKIYDRIIGCDITIFIKNIKLINVFIPFHNYKEYLNNIFEKTKIKQLVYLYDRFNNDTISVIYSSKDFEIYITFENKDYCKFKLSQLSYDNICDYKNNINIGKEKLFNSIDEIKNIIKFVSLKDGVGVTYKGLEYKYYSYEKDTTNIILEKIKEKSNTIDNIISKNVYVKNKLKNNIWNYSIEILEDDIQKIKIINKRNNTCVYVDTFLYETDYILNNMDVIFLNKKIEYIKSKLELSNFKLDKFYLDENNSLNITIGEEYFNLWEYNFSKQKNKERYKNLKHVSKFIVKSNDIMHKDIEVLIKKINDYIKSELLRYENGGKSKDKIINILFKKDKIYNKNKLKNIKNIRKYQFLKEVEFVDYRTFIYKNNLITIPLSFTNIESDKDRKDIIKKLLNEINGKDKYVKKNNNKLGELLENVESYYLLKAKVSEISFDHTRNNGYYTIEIKKNNIRFNILIKHYNKKFFIINTKTYIEAEKDLINYISNIIRDKIYNK